MLYISNKNIFKRLVTLHDCVNGILDKDFPFVHDRRSFMPLEYAAEFFLSSPFMETISRTLSISFSASFPDRPIKEACRDRYSNPERYGGIMCCSAIYPMCLRDSGSDAGSPLIVMLPEEGLIKSRSIRTMVVLPAPFGPSNAKDSPF